MELCIDQLVDVVVLGLGIPFELVVFGQDDQRAANCEGGEASHDKGLASFTSGYQTVFGNFGAGIVTGKEQGQVGDIAFAAIGVAGFHNHLLGCTLAIEDAVFGIQIHTHTGGDGGGIIGCVGIEPADDGVPIHVIFSKTSAPGVGNFTSRFFEQQAFLGAGHIEPATVQFSGKAVVITFGVEAKE